jgi:hypothetical protein
MGGRHRKRRGTGPPTTASLLAFLIALTIAIHTDSPTLRLLLLIPTGIALAANVTNIKPRAS